MIMEQQTMFDHISMDKDEALEMYDLETLIIKYPDRARKLIDYYYKDMDLDLSALYKGDDPFKGGDINPDDIPADLQFATCLKRQVGEYKYER